MATTSFNEFCEIINNFTFNKRIMRLDIFVDSKDNELLELYKQSAYEHNQKIMNDPHFYDAGFDLFLPKNSESDSKNEEIEFKATGWSRDCPSNKIDFKVNCCAKIYNIENLVKEQEQEEEQDEELLYYINGNGNRNKEITYSYSGFYVYARSSISKTPLRLANNVGIIDAGYRGHLIGMFDNTMNASYTHSNKQSASFPVPSYFLPAYSRLLQICGPSLEPIYVNIVESFDELGPSTSRGNGGFGSSGLSGIKK